MEQKVKEIWLGYFNDVLFEKGVITEQERNQMEHLIYVRCHAPNLKTKTKG